MISPSRRMTDSAGVIFILKIGSRDSAGHNNYRLQIANGHWTCSTETKQLKTTERPHYKRNKFRVYLQVHTTIYTLENILNRLVPIVQWPSRNVWTARSPGTTVLIRRLLTRIGATRYRVLSSTLLADLPHLINQQWDQLITNVNNRNVLFSNGNSPNSLDILSVLCGSLRNWLEVADIFWIQLSNPVIDLLTKLLAVFALSKTCPGSSLHFSAKEFNQNLDEFDQNKSIRLNRYG